MRLDPDPTFQVGSGYGSEKNNLGSTTQRHGSVFVWFPGFWSSLVKLGPFLEEKMSLKKLGQFNFNKFYVKTKKFQLEQILITNMK